MRTPTGIAFVLLSCLLSVSVRAQPTVSAAGFTDENIGLKLASTAQLPLVLNLDDLDRALLGTICRFRQGTGVAVSIDGGLLFEQDAGSLAAYASAVEENYRTHRKLASLTLISERKLARKPGEWVMRELEVVDFNTRFRCLHVYVKDGEDYYALMMRCNAREDEAASRQAFHHIVSGLTVAGVANGPLEIPAGENPQVPTGPKKPGVGFAGLAFTSLGNERDIYVFEEGKTKPVNITNRPGIDYQPAFSRDGTRIAFVSGRNADPRTVGLLSGIYTMNPDGSDVQWIVRDAVARNPRWSADGSQLVYETRTNAAGKSVIEHFIYVVNADGSGKRALVEVPGGYCREPDWSPDGSKIVFTQSTNAIGDHGLYTINPDGSGKTLIVSTVRGGSQPRLPRYSPDGRRIIFSGQSWSQGLGFANEHPDPCGATLICNQDGSGLYYEHLVDEARPMFLPKGNKIAFMAMHGGDFVRSGNGLDVFVKNVGEVATSNLTKDTGGVFDFDISPLTSDDKLPKRAVPYDIVFARAGTGQKGEGTSPECDLFVLSEDGKQFANLSQTQVAHTTETRPSWSPDKTKIVFESTEPYWIDGEREARSGLRNIWVMDADGSNKVNLTKYRGNESCPIWSPDGATIAFFRENNALMFMNANGSEVRRERTNRSPLGRTMTWSNDSALLVTSGATGGYKMEAGTVTASDPLWSFVEKGTAVDPDWNPTSTEVAYFGFNSKEKWALLRFDFPAGGTNEVVEQTRGHNPSWGPDGCRIIFDEDDGNSGSQLWIADIHKPDPKDLVNLTAVSMLDGRNVHPDWAAKPHPKPRVASAPTCIFVVTLDGGSYVVSSVSTTDWAIKEVGRFSATRFMDDYPVFSASGNRCAVGTVEGTGGKILVSSLSGRPAVAVVDGFTPSLSPDGKKLAFLSASRPSEVHIYDLESGESPIRRQGPKARPGGDEPRLNWSADGSTLYFASNFSESTGWTPSILYALSSDGTRQTGLWEVPDQRLFFGVRGSPDGSSLLVHCRTTSGVDEIYAMDAVGGSARKLMDGAFPPSVAWSDDSRRVYAARPDKLDLVNFDGTDVRSILPGGLNLLHWNPRGDKALVLGRTSSGRQGVFLSDVDGRNLNWLNRIPGEVLVATWCGERMAGDPRVATQTAAPPAGAKVFVLKGGKPRIKNIYDNTETPPAGWTASATAITRSYETRVGALGEEQRTVRYSGQLQFQGPPATLHEGQEIELSMTASGDAPTSMMGEWRLGLSEAVQGVDCVGLQSVDTRTPRPTSGSLRFRVAKNPYDLDFTITLTCEKAIDVIWSYELKK